HRDADEAPRQRRRVPPRPEELLRKPAGADREDPRTDGGDPQAGHPGRPRRRRLSASDLHPSRPGPPDALLRNHPAQRQPRIRQGQLQGALRSDRGGAGSAGQSLMPIYRRLGKIPPKRHTAFKQPDGSLYPEELIGSHGFSGPSALLYHLRRPTTAVSVKMFRELKWEPDPDATVKPRHFRTSALATGPSAVVDRVPMLFNHDVALSMARPQKDDDFFYRNGQADEMIYVSQGAGVLESIVGNLPFRQGDYLVIPRGILHRYKLGAGPHAFLVVESAGSVRVPKRYRNEYGQLLESSPYGERDLRGPEDLVVHDKKGPHRILAKRNDALTELVLDHHPFDVVGWDGYYYPWAFNIRDFEPRVGRI